jgi:hypothetical protein
MPTVGPTRSNYPFVMRITLLLCFLCAHEAAAFSFVAGLHSIGYNVIHARALKMERVVTLRPCRHNVPLGLRCQIGSGGPPMDNEPLDLSEETVKQALLETKQVLCSTISLLSSPILILDLSRQGARYDFW